MNKKSIYIWLKPKQWIFNTSEIKTDSRPICLTDIEEIAIKRNEENMPFVNLFMNYKFVKHMLVDFDGPLLCARVLLTNEILKKNEK